MLVIIAIVENIHPSPPNKPPAFFFLGIYVAVLPTALETVLGGGGGVRQRGLSHRSSAAGVVSPGSRGSGIGQGLEGRLKCCQSLCPAGQSLSSH